LGRTLWARVETSPLIRSSHDLRDLQIAGAVQDVEPCVRFESDHPAADIAKRTAEISTKDVAALLALSYLLDDM
jgi:hypothetical protein